MLSLPSERAVNQWPSHRRASSRTCNSSRKLAERRFGQFVILVDPSLSQYAQNTDRQEQIRILEKLLAVAVNSYQRIRVLLTLISARFDYNSSVATHMPIELWNSAQGEVDQLIGIIMHEPAYVIQETTDEYDELAERSPETEKEGIVRIRGSVISFVDRLDDEFTKSLQNIDPHGTEYVDRLKDEKALYCTICLSQALYEKNKSEDPLGRVIMRRLEHIYSKVSSVLFIRAKG